MAIAGSRASWSTATTRWWVATRSPGSCEWPAWGVTRRKFCRTTRRDDRARPAPDLLERDFTASAPNRRWVADITYVPTWAGFLFLAVVLDVCSRKVVGWSMSANQNTELVTRALQMAVQRARPTGVVVHHSDQGSQGEFDRSSQHLDRGGVDGPASGMDEGVDGSLLDEVAGGAVRIDGRSKPRVLASDRHGGSRPRRPTLAVGVSQAAGARWFRHRGGMPIDLSPATGRYLSFHEREEIALSKAPQAPPPAGVREIARRLGRHPSTVSRRTAPGRGDPRRQARLPSVGRPVEGRARGPASQDRQARRQRSAAQATSKNGWPVTSAVRTGRRLQVLRPHRGKAGTSPTAETAAG